MSSLRKEDIKYIKRCFTLAKRGWGKVSPNPLVGAVLVKDGKIIGEGWHKTIKTFYQSQTAYIPDDQRRWLSFVPDAKSAVECIKEQL